MSGMECKRGNCESAIRNFTRSQPPVLYHKKKCLPSASNNKNIRHTGRKVMHITSEARNIYEIKLTQWGRVLHDKLTVAHIFKKFTDFYETQKFVHRDPLVDPILGQLNPVHVLVSYVFQTYILIGILILFHLCLSPPSGCFPLGFRSKFSYTFLTFPMHAACITHGIPLDRHNT